MLPENQKFEFDDFLLDAREQILLRGDKPQPLTPKAFRLLHVLVKNHGHLVEKDKLMKEVWADSFVEEANLSFTIGLLRKALSDNAQNPRFIETVPKRGYRFIAEVKSIADQKNEGKFDLYENPTQSQNNGASSSANLRHRATTSENKFQAAVVPLAEWRGESKAKDSEKESKVLEFPSDTGDKQIAEKTEKPNPRPGSRKYAVLAIVLVLAGSIALGTYFFSAKNSEIGKKKSFAVLPLKPINASVRDEIYEIGIADSLIYRLSSVNGFVVRPLSAVRKYADIEQDPLAAGREQQVDYVLASNYQLANGKIRVTAQLFNVANGQIEETYKTEKEAGNIFKMQDELAGEVGNILAKRFGAVSSSPTAIRGTTVEEAYRLYLQGMNLCDKRNLADARKAVEVLEQAVSLDPNYALAWAGKAYAHRVAGNHGRSVDTHEEYQKSIEAVNKALALDANLPEAYSALCDNKMYYEYDFAGAERACKHAIELDPNSSLSHQVYSRFLNSRGRFDEAIKEIKTAIDLEPTSYHNQRNLGVSLYFARRYEEAETQLKRVMEMDENSPSTYHWLRFVLEVQGKQSETFEFFLKDPRLQNEDGETLRAFQTAYQTSGWQGVQRERVKRFESDGDAYFQGAIYCAQIGDKDKAFEYLEKSFQRRELWMANLQVEPRLDPLRDDPRFAELVRRVEKK